MKKREIEKTSLSDDDFEELGRCINQNNEMWGNLDLSSLDKINISDVAKKILGNVIEKEKIDAISQIVSKWSKPSVAIAVLAGLPQIISENKQKKFIDFCYFEGALKKFCRAVSESGVGQTNAFPTFGPSLLKMIEAYRMDSIRYLFKPSNYALKKVESISQNGQKNLRLKPHIKRGQPTTVMRDLAVAGVLKLVQDKLGMTSTKEAIYSLLPILRLCGGPNEKGAIEKIIRRAPDSIMSEPPSFETVKARMKQSRK